MNVMFQFTFEQIPLMAAESTRLLRPSAHCARVVQGSNIDGRVKVAAGKMETHGRT